MHAFAQAGAFERDDALITLGMLALIDGEREIAGADQMRHRECGVGAELGELGHVELRIAADRAGGGDVGDHHADRPVALGLEREDALVFERARQRHGERDRLAQHGGNRRRIGMALQDGVDNRSQSHQPSAQAEGVDLERLDDVVRWGFEHQP